MTIRYETPGFGASTVLMALRLPVGLAHSVGELRYQGRRSGRRIALPVSYVRMGERVAVRVGHSDAKRWWRNFLSPHPISIRVAGEWLDGTGRVVSPGTIEHEEVEAVYQSAHRGARLDSADPYVMIDAHERLAPGARPQDARKNLWRTWFRRVTLGELLGFTAPALAGALAADAVPWVLAVALPAAGAIEGAVLGRFQAGVLRSALRGFPVRDWTVVTAVAAVFAWAIGLVPVLFGDRITDWPPLVQAPVIAVGATVLVFSIGTAQWLVLRRWSDRAVLWIWATAAGWIAGLIAFTLVTTPLWQEGQAAVTVAAIGILGGLVMAATMAAVTGAFLVRILARNHVIDHG